MLRSIFSTDSCLQSDNGVSTSNSPLRQSIAENGSVPPQQLLRGQEDTPRRAVRFSPSTSENRHAVRRAPTARTRASEENPPVHVLHTSRKRMTPSTESCYGLCLHASVCQVRCQPLSASSMKACELACVRMVNTRSGLTSLRGCGKDVCSHRFFSISSSLL